MAICTQVRIVKAAIWLFTHIERQITPCYLPSAGFVMEILTVLKKYIKNIYSFLGFKEQHARRRNLLQCAF